MHYHYIVTAYIAPVFTWLNATSTITLIRAATVQTRSPFDTRKQYLSHYFHNQLWAPLSVVTIRGAASNQVNMIIFYSEVNKTFTKREK